MRSRQVTIGAYDGAGVAAVTAAAPWRTSAGPRPATRAPSANGAGFVLFLLVNAALFVRPAELVPELLGQPIYEGIILLCLAAAWASVVRQLALRSLVDEPITACVVGLLGAVVLSHLSSFYVYGARTSGFEFLKVVIYYLLLVGTVDSPRRLRQFLLCLLAFALVATVLAVLQYHGAINIPSLTAMEQEEVNPETGEVTLLLRMVSTGIYNDPNDLCLLLVTAIALCLFELGDAGQRAWRGFWLVPLCLFGYALTLTFSRGGFLALIAAAMVLFQARFGWRRTIPLAAVALPAMFVLFAGRQTQMDLGEGSGQERIQIWSDALTLFREAPVFGIGAGNMYERLARVAHNSFLHAYAELGIAGGTLFLGAFYIAFRQLHRLGSPDASVPDPALRRLRPFLIALVGGYSVGMLSLSRTYLVPTYMVLGVAQAYLRLAPAEVPVQRLDAVLVRRMAMAGVAFLVCTYVFVRLFVHRG